MQLEALKLSNESMRANIEALADENFELKSNQGWSKEEEAKLDAARTEIAQLTGKLTAAEREKLDLELAVRSAQVAAGTPATATPAPVATPGSGMFATPGSSLRNMFARR